MTTSGCGHAFAMLISQQIQNCGKMWGLRLPYFGAGLALNPGARGGEFTPEAAAELLCSGHRRSPRNSPPTVLNTNCLELYVLAALRLLSSLFCVLLITRFSSCNSVGIRFPLGCLTLLWRLPPPHLLGAILPL